MTVNIRTAEGDLVTEAEYHRLEADKRRHRAKRHGLTVAQLDAAERTGMDPSDFARWAKVKTDDDANALREMSDGQDQDRGPGVTGAHRDARLAPRHRGRGSGARQARPGETEDRAPRRRAARVGERSPRRRRGQGARQGPDRGASQSVGRLAVALHSALRNRQLRLPDDDDLLDELANVRLRETTPGVIRMDHDPDRHDDQAIALALCVQELLSRPTAGGADSINYRPTPGHEMTTSRGGLVLTGERFFDIDRDSGELVPPPGHTVEEAM